MAQMGERQLTSSGWIASWSPDVPSLIWLDYMGKRPRRYQSVIRYHDGQIGYEWPEIVPPTVKRKIVLLLDELHEKYPQDQ